MKTFGKKLISLMLVALMLVAAVPFGVFAEEENDVEEEVALQELSGPRDVSVSVTVKNGNGEEVTTETGYLKNFPSDSEYDALSDAKKIQWAKDALSAVGLTASNYTVTKDSGSISSGTYSVEVQVGKHTCNIKYTSNDDGTHDKECAICGDSYKDEPCAPSMTVKANSGSETGHVLVCSKCGYEKTTADHSDEKKTTVKGKSATCTEAGTTDKITYECGYTEGGEEDPNKPALGHNFKNGRCTRCNAVEDTNSYTVVISYDGSDIASGSVQLSASAAAGYENGTLSDAKAILNKATSSDSLFKAYAGSMTTNVFQDMSITGTTITITVKKDLTDSVVSKTVFVDIIDGTETESRELTVGKRYFAYSLALTNSNNKTLASIRVYNTTTGSRTIRSTDNDSASKVQAGDESATLLWDAKEVTIEFYRHGGNGAKKVDTMTVRAGESISGLPLLDGNYVTWYLESGELLQEGRTYDFKSTTVRAYPSTNGDVYLMIYKNGDTKTPVRSNPENITAYVQNNGLVSVKDLKTVVENVVGKKGTAYLFDFDGWENYKATKSTKDSADTFDVGTADSRTGVQFLYVMVTGASGSSNADSSNPKTGDTAMIGTATAVLAVAALGLGTATVVLKKKEEF